MTKAENDVKFVEENDRLVVNGRQKPPEKTTFASFIYNKQEGKFLGRTAKSWSQILIFYLIFYTLLAVFWIACLYIFLQTIDKELPRYHGPNTIIGSNPGVGYHPWLKDDPESTLIKFNVKDPKSYQRYIKAISDYLGKYTKTNGTRECKGKESNADFIKDGKVIGENAKACRFDLKIFEDNECGTKDDFGFKSGQPCVILSLNRLIGWTPKPFGVDEIPKEVKARYKDDSIAFNCEGTSESDKELLGNVRYIPPDGISGRFYPFAVMKQYQYHQPIAMVKFSQLPRNRIVMVECRAFAKNIEHDQENRIGMVTFELLLQDNTSSS